MAPASRSKVVSRRVLGNDRKVFDPSPSVCLHRFNYAQRMVRIIPFGKISALLKSKT